MKDKVQILVLVLVQILTISTTFSQGIAINEDGANPDNSAMLDIHSTSKGILIPKMTTNQRNMINMPATGLLVFDTDIVSFLL